jgi:hypothetical protein
MTKAFASFIAGLAVLTALSFSHAAAQPGIFEGSGDVGSVLHPGSIGYDEAGKSYKVTGWRL